MRWRGRSARAVSAAGQARKSQHGDSVSRGTSSCASSFHTRAVRLAGYLHTCAVVFKHDFGIGNSGIDGILDDALNFGPVILAATSAARTMTSASEQTVLLPQGVDKYFIKLPFANGLQLGISGK